MVKATLPEANAEKIASPQAVVLPYKKRPQPVRATLRVPRARQAVAAAR
jgi:hypothetical protein